MEHREQRSPRNDRRDDRRRNGKYRFQVSDFGFAQKYYSIIPELENYWFLNCNQIDRDHSRDRSHRSERGGYRSDGPFTIKMGGLPYKATVNEIIDWFHPRANCIDVRIFRGRDNR